MIHQWIFSCNEQSPTIAICLQIINQTRSEVLRKREIYTICNFPIHQYYQLTNNCADDLSIVTDSLFHSRNWRKICQNFRNKIRRSALCATSPRFLCLVLPNFARGTSKKPKLRRRSEIQAEGPNTGNSSSAARVSHTTRLLTLSLVNARNL